MADETPRELALTDDERRALRGELPDWSDATFQIERATPEQIETVWRAYWRPLLLMQAEGESEERAVARFEAALRVLSAHLNVAALKAELFDAYMLVDRARAVYRAATGNLCDDLTASPEGIIALLNHRILKNADVWRDRAHGAEARIAELERTIARRAGTHGHG